jgi:hypothetical protein
MDLTTLTLIASLISLGLMVFFIVTMVWIILLLQDIKIALMPLQDIKLELRMISDDQDARTAQRLKGRKLYA